MQQIDHRASLDLQVRENSTFFDHDSPLVFKEITADKIKYLEQLIILNNRSKFNDLEQIR